jgi:hypothetical protein
MMHFSVFLMRLNPSIAIFLLVIALGAAGVASTRATTIGLDSESDFFAFSFVNQNATLGYGATAGVGGSGGGVFQSTVPSVDRRVLGFTSSLGSASSLTAFSVSARINGSSLLPYVLETPETTSDFKPKTKIRFGLLGGTTIVDSAKPQDMWKTNASVNAEFEMKYEYKVADGSTKTESKVAVKSSTGNASESNLSGDIKTTSVDFWDSWIELRLDASLVEVDGTQLLKLTYGVYSLGADGVSVPTLVEAFGTGSYYTSNTAILGASDLHFGFMLEGDKSAPNVPFTIDDLGYSVQAVPEPATLALLLAAGLMALLVRRNRGLCR